MTDHVVALGPTATITTDIPAADWRAFAAICEKVRIDPFDELRGHVLEVVADHRDEEISQ